MHYLTRLVAVFILITMAIPVSARVHRGEHRDVQTDAGSGLGEILDLWRNGDYEELWLRTKSKSGQSKESFVGRLESAGRRPACCWEKLQDVTVTAVDDRKATVQAKVGLEGNGLSTEFVTKRFKMVNENGFWKMSMSDILSLAENGKKKYRRHYSRKKQNITIYPPP